MFTSRGYSGTRRDEVRITDSDGKTREKKEAEHVPSGGDMKAEVQGRCSTPLKALPKTQQNQRLQTESVKQKRRVGEMARKQRASSNSKPYFHFFPSDACSCRDKAVQRPAAESLICKRLTSGQVGKWMH